MANRPLEGLNAVISREAAGVGSAASEIFAREGARIAIIISRQQRCQFRQRRNAVLR